jgi:pimeloyl-ACP methyl ester carboxylesterase
MQRIATSLGELAIESHGSGPPVVLLHSGGHDRHDFDAVVPALAKRFRTIAVDLPGHGDSQMFESPALVSVQRICMAVGELLAKLSLPPAIFVGNSVGGSACLHLALEQPQRVRALVLVSTSGLVELSPLARAFCWLQGRHFVRRRLGMAFARHYLWRRSDEAVALLDRMARRRRDPAFIAMEAALWRSFGHEESHFGARASAIRCPTLLVWGKHDPVLRMRVEGARARALLPHAAWRELGCGHVPFVEDPKSFLDAIMPFVCEVVADETNARL